MPKRYEEIVRFMETDLDGNKHIDAALREIKGINFQMSSAILAVSGFDPKIKIKDLKEEDMNKLEEIIKNPVAHGIPAWMVNRRKDMETGADVHVVSSDLGFLQRSDIDRAKKLRTWVGIRHELGQPVRGQRTRSSFRTSGRVVGVSRKAAKAAIAAAAAPTAGAKPAPGVAPAAAPGAKPAPAAPGAKAAPAVAAKPGAAPSAKLAPTKKEEKK